MNDWFYYLWHAITLATPDFFNGLFESIGAIFIWKNAHKLWQHKCIRGTYWPSTVFFTSWGFWNLYYYPNLHQWFSFVGGCALVAGNFAWIVMAWKYRNN